MNIVDKILESKAKKIKRMPMMNNRASMIGYFMPELQGCLRRGVYERTCWEQKEMHDARTQLVFDEGNNQEATVLRDMSEAGIQAIEQQSAFVFPEQMLSGHLDCVVIEDGKAVPVEIKSMSPFIFDSVFTLGDFNKKPWTKAYLAQIQVYMLNKGVDRGYFLLKNKSTGGLKQIEVGLDYQFAENVLKTCEAINKHVADKTMPERITEVETCGKCPFRLVCCPGISFGVEMQIGDDPMFTGRLDTHFSLKIGKEDYDANYEIIKNRVKATANGGPIKMICGKYQIEGKPDSRGAFRFSIDII